MNPNDATRGALWLNDMGFDHVSYDVTAGAACLNIHGQIVYLTQVELDSLVASLLTIQRETDDYVERMMEKLSSEEL